MKNAGNRSSLSDIFPHCVLCAVRGNVCFSKAFHVVVFLVVWSDLRIITCMAKASGLIDLFINWKLG